jgi:hypothetical protein
VAAPALGTKVISGESKMYLLNADNSKGCTWHHISGDSPGIVVELGKPFFINTLRLRLRDKDR